jgi:hypothetical protein
LTRAGFLKSPSHEGLFFKDGREWKIRLQRGTIPSAAVASPPPVTEQGHPPLVAELVRRGMTAATAVKLVAKYPAEKIEQKIEVLDWKMTQPQPPKNPAGYLRTSLTDDYAPPKDFVGRAERERQEQARQAGEHQAADVRRQHQAGEFRDQERRREEDAYWSKLTPTEQADLEAKALAAASGPIRATYLRMNRQGIGGGYLSMIRREYIRTLIDAEQAAGLA